MRSTSMSYRTIPEEPHEPSAMDELSKDMGSVISGLVEFKSELLQLHAMVGAQRLWGGGGGGR